MGSCLTKKNKYKLAEYDPNLPSSENSESFGETGSNFESQELEPMQMTDYRSLIMRRYKKMMASKVYHFRKLKNDY